MIEELHLKLEGLRRELLGQQERCTMNVRVIQKIRRALQEIYIVRNNQDDIKAQCLGIYRTYVQEDGPSIATSK